MVKRIAILIVVIATAGVLAGVSLSHQAKLGATPDHLKLKAPKSDILGNVKKDGEVKYAYKGKKMDESIPQVLGGKAIVGEDVGKRTKHARVFDTAEENVKVAEIIAGVPQYYEDPQGLWWQAEYATTTEAVFIASTKDTFIEKIAKKIVGSAQAATDFFPDANPETSTVDGVTSQSSTDVTWASIVAAAGNQANDSGANGWSFVRERTSGTSNQYVENYRGIFLFATGDTLAGVTITAATFSFYGDTVTATHVLNATDRLVHVVSSAPAANTSLAAGDYDSLGSTSFGSFDPGASFASVNLADYNDITLNATGIAAISQVAAGVTKFGTKFAADLNGSITTSWSSDVIAGITTTYAETAGTTSDPKLTVTFTTGGGGGDNGFMEYQNQFNSYVD